MDVGNLRMLDTNCIDTETMPTMFILLYVNVAWNMWSGSFMGVKMTN